MKESAPAALPSRLPGIDIIRGVAASAVLVHHVMKWNGAGPSPLPAPLSTMLQAVWDVLGHWGVGVFFVLSGLCIHLPVARKLAAGVPPAMELGPYMKRRFRRIYPPHLLVIFLSWGVAAWVPHVAGLHEMVSQPTTTQFWAHIFMVHTFVPGATYSINVVLWSIALEAHFYLLYPLILRLRRHVRMDVMVAAAFLVMLALRAADKLVFADVMRGMLTYNFPGRWWEWLLGAALAERVAAGKVPRLSAPWVAACLAISAGVAAALMNLPSGIAVLGVLGPWTYGVLVAVTLGMYQGRGWLYRACLAVGLRSYSLYLVHPLTVTVALFVVAGVAPWPVAVGVALAVSYAGTWLYYRGVERQFLNPPQTRARPPTPQQS